MKAMILDLKVYDTLQPQEFKELTNFCWLFKIMIYLVSTYKFCEISILNFKIILIQRNCIMSLVPYSPFI